MYKIFRYAYADFLLHNINIINKKKDIIFIDTIFYILDLISHFYFFLLNFAYVHGVCFSIHGEFN